MQELPSQMQADILGKGRETTYEHLAIYHIGQTSDK